jgi:hypothetical protein
MTRLIQVKTHYSILAESNAIPVRDVTLVSIGQSRDDVSEGGERLVDVLGLVKNRTFGSGFADLHNIENKGFFFHKIVIF